MKLELTKLQDDNDRSLQRETLYEAMQKHLCMTLAHFIVFIGSKLELPIHSTAERSFLNGAHVRWQKDGSFLWKLTWDRFGQDECRCCYVSSCFIVETPLSTARQSWNHGVGQSNSALKSSNSSINETQDRNKTLRSSSFPGYDRNWYSSKALNPELEHTSAFLTNGAHYQNHKRCQVVPVKVNNPKVFSVSLSEHMSLDSAIQNLETIGGGTYGIGSDATLYSPELKGEQFSATCDSPVASQSKW
jgi:hypothetical protein